MSDILLLYLFTRLDALHMLLGWFLVFVLFGMLVFGILGLFYITGHEIDEGPAWAKYRQYMKRAVITFAAILFLQALMPTQTDMAIIVGGKVALDVGRSDTAQAVGNEVLDAIRAQLKKAAE